MHAVGVFVILQSSGWSAEAMFETNKSKFNVESSFNEEMIEYTYVGRSLACSGGEYSKVCVLSGHSWIAWTPRTSE